MRLAARLALRNADRAAAEVARLRRACRSSQGPSLGGFVGNACQRKYGRSREGPPAEDSLVRPPGAGRRKAEHHPRAGCRYRRFARGRLASALLFFVQRAVTRFWRSRHPARPRIFAGAISPNPGAPARGKDGGCA